jgi:hypothetical protein
MLDAKGLVLCVLLASPSGVGAADASAAGRLQLTASPSALRLAEGSRATLRIVGCSEPPVLAASVGHIELLRESSPGIYTAEYVPPESLDPQIAFVTASSAEGFGWIPIPLSGVRDVTVSARYGTPVSVSVEAEVFGPVPADGMGRANVRVVVPPGVRSARYERQRIDLSVPDKSLVHVFLSSTAADANAPAAVTVNALVVNERGKPLAGAAVSLKASEGALSPPVEVEAGVLEARWKLAPGKVGQAFVTARVRDRPASVATAALERVPGPPRSIAIEVDREQLVAGEGDELSVTARVLDVAGNTTECATNIVVDPGVVLEWERTGRGRYEGRVQVPRRRPGWQQLEIKVVASRTLSAKRVVPLLPGPVRQVRIEHDEDLRADGLAHEIRVLALDRDGNRVDVAGVPTVTADRGKVGPVERNGPGVFLLKYRAPLDSEDLDDVIRARVGSLEGEARLRVRALGGGLVIAPKVGFTLGTGGVKSPSGGVELGLWSRVSGQSMGLVLEGWVYTYGRSDTLQGMDLKTEVRYLALEASLAWRRPLRGWLLWLGAGGGAVYASSKVSGIPGQASLSGSSWAPAANGSVGFGRPLGPGVPFGEIRAAWQADPGSGPIRGSVRSLILNVGYRFDVR